MPICIRSDHGVENFDVWRFMIATNDGDPSCVITGSSTHNERIERLWRDVHRCVVMGFADIFQDLEAEKYLDPLNDVDLYCLHYIFLPRINKCLSEFQSSWNNHPLSTEANMSPYQLFYEGTSYIADHFDINVSLANVDIADIDVPLGNNEVVVNRIAFIPCHSLMANLLRSVNPSSSDSGKDLFLRCIDITALHLLNGCLQCSN